MADGSGEDVKIEYPKIPPFTEDEIAVIHELCVTHFSIPKIAEGLGISVESITSNLLMMDYIRETRQKDEIQFWEKIKSMAIVGDKNSMEMFMSRMNAAKINDYE